MDVNLNARRSVAGLREEWAVGADTAPVAEMPTRADGAQVSTHAAHGALLPAMRPTGAIYSSSVESLANARMVEDRWKAASERYKLFPYGIALLNRATQDRTPHVLSSPTVKAAFRRVEAMTQHALSRQYAVEVQRHVKQEWCLTQPSPGEVERLRPLCTGGFWQSLKRTLVGTRNDEIFALDTYANEIQHYIDVHDAVALELDKSALLAAGTDAATAEAWNAPGCPSAGQAAGGNPSVPDLITAPSAGAPLYGPPALHAAVLRAERAMATCLALRWPPGIRQEIRKLLEAVYISPVAVANFRHFYVESFSAWVARRRGDTFGRDTERVEAYARAIEYIAARAHSLSRFANSAENAGVRIDCVGRNAFFPGAADEEAFGKRLLSFAGCLAVRRDALRDLTYQTGAVRLAELRPEHPD